VTPLRTMSIYAVNEHELELQVSTNTGFGQFGRWAESLPKKQFPEVVVLWEQGLSRQAPELAEQLQKAQRLHEPDADVKDFIHGVLKICEGAQYVMMTNGMSTDEG
jgi:hypothetical protein